MGDFSIEHDRRERDAQRDAVAELIPDSGGASLLRKADGEVLVYEEQDEKRRPLELRAVVMPDGSIQHFNTRRFGRG